MKVEVNERNVECPEGTDQTVESLISALRDRNELHATEAVSAVCLDDEAWEMQHLAEALDRELHGVSRVSIRTSNLREYALKVLSESNGILDVLLRRTREVAQTFRAGKSLPANVGLFRLLDAVHRYLVCLCSVQNACSPDFRPFQQQESPLVKVARSLKRIEEKQREEDWRGLANNLEESLHPALSELSGTITILKESI